MIIDTHLHIGGEAVGFEMNEQMVVEAMEKYQIAYGLVSYAEYAGGLLKKGIAFC